MFTTILTSIGMLTGVGGLVLGGYALVRAREISGDSRALAERAVSVNASGVDPRAVRDVAVLHYDALEEMSGARSFSLALLNSDGDGVVLTSINGRTESRTYAKEITRGEADTLLSPEEYRVIRSARLGNGVGASAAPVAGAAVVRPRTGGEDGGRSQSVAAEEEVPVTVFRADDASDAAVASDISEGDPVGDLVGDPAGAPATGA
ncbi:DUF4446 family protein [Nocardiopsis sp. EMB25]|uniref:DUF4446 family protein n=1 Tax=Nocardiopsis sp. EMB25 TaxID=2835867 RepID=UPI00228456A5|nr:DUF4446 family protein [Nocardiopsis sp. EMB25]MCY9786515.1 DUF4446 family protein [Nocardiopsis sp. EMB25]